MSVCVFAAVVTVYTDSACICECCQEGGRDRRSIVPGLNLLLA